jgi:hypothetical protein
MVRSNPSSKSQLRLILESTWIKELDVLAASRFQSRLALIRFYLRQAMDKDLSELDEFLRQRKQKEDTCKRLQSYIDDHHS